MFKSLARSAAAGFVAVLLLVGTSAMLSNEALAQVRTPSGPATGSPVVGTLTNTAQASANGAVCPSYNVEFVNYQTGARQTCLNGVLAQPPLLTSSICVSSASPAVCGASRAGFVTIAAAATSKVVNNSSVTANSQILLTFDSSLGTTLGVTCNTTLATPYVTARTAGTSFTITVGAAPSTNPACYDYVLVN